MQQKTRILWLDNQPVLNLASVDHMRSQGYTVEEVKTITHAERLLSERRYNLLILDVMIPSFDEEEERRYPPSMTDGGYRAGLVFYERHKDSLAEKGTRVLVVTNRQDEEIFLEFMRLELPRICFATQYDCRDPEKLLARVEEVLKLK